MPARRLVIKQSRELVVLLRRRTAEIPREQHQGGQWDQHIRQNNQHVVRCQVASRAASQTCCTAASKKKTAGAIATPSQ